MASEFLEVYRENAALTLAETLALLDADDLDLSTLLFVCTQYRIKGIAGLLLYGDVREFTRDLHNSSRAFAYGLHRLPESGKITSKAAPFFDAMAVNDSVGASEIAQGARASWREDVEYEDDFLYVFFLMEHFFLGGTHALPERLLARYAEVLDGSSDARFDLCRAFLEADEEAFHEAFDAYLVQQEERQALLVSRGALAPEREATEAFVNVEGLGLLRLAEQKGFTMQDNYLLIPSMARINVSVAFSSNGWRKIIE